ncbi:uncharacterized protein LOC114735241 [Neltuma alba]|uniref:uncharacterized protein LOC114735241 n=1 Tax=Neltuma alba TaxID=207710 RepID=UPI0010A35801|nr:uncharacterized protein LOC114735241 [Prosopis alba]
MVHPQEQHHQIQNSDVCLQEDVSGCWGVQDSGCLSSLSLQNKNNVGDDMSADGYMGDELYNDQKSSSTSMLDIHYGDDERNNEIGFEPEELVDRSEEEGVLFKIENSVLKAEADCIQQDQDHDLKGAATLFTLTNCTT